MRLEVLSLREVVWTETRQVNTLVSPRDSILTVEVLNGHSVVERNVRGRYSRRRCRGVHSCTPRGTDYISSFHSRDRAQLLHVNPLY